MQREIVVLCVVKEMLLLALVITTITIVTIIIVSFSVIKVVLAIIIVVLVFLILVLFLLQSIFAIALSSHKDKKEIASAKNITNIHTITFKATCSKATYSLLRQASLRVDLRLAIVLVLVDLADVVLLVDRSSF